MGCGGHGVEFRGLGVGIRVQGLGFGAAGGASSSHLCPTPSPAAHPRGPPRAKRVHASRRRACRAPVVVMNCHERGGVQRVA